jgi:hypothetical protein
LEILIHIPVRILLTLSLTKQTKIVLYWINTFSKWYRNFIDLFNECLGTTSTIRTPIIYDVGNGGASGDPPCSSYTVVNDPLRNVATSGIGGTCDNGPLFNTSIGGRWIRFVGIGGTTMPLTSPGRNHCGAFLSGWFNGTLPSTIGTIVSADICFELNYIPSCELYDSASVVNCSSFYVYFLPPVIICNSRYCTIWIGSVFFRLYHEMIQSGFYRLELKYMQINIIFFIKKAIF